MISGNPCESNPCRNGKCEATPDQLEYFCNCSGTDWTGKHCEIDADDDCASSPCSSVDTESTCLDTYKNFYCGCSLSFYGKSCEKRTSEWKGAVLYVDADLDVQQDECGTEENPCKDLDAALAMVSDGDVIQLQPSRNVYQLGDNRWLSKSLTIQGTSNSEQNTSDTVLNTGLGFLISPIDSAQSRRMHVIFQRLKIENSSILVGNVNISFNHVELSNIQVMQQFIEKKPVDLFALSFEHSTITESHIATHPGNVEGNDWGISEENYQPTFYTVNSAALLIKNSYIHSTSLNITSKLLTVNVEKTVFTNNRICPDKSGQGELGIQENSGLVNF